MRHLIQRCTRHGENTGIRRIRVSKLQTLQQSKQSRWWKNKDESAGAKFTNDDRSRGREAADNRVRDQVDNSTESQKSHHKLRSRQSGCDLQRESRIARAHLRRADEKREANRSRDIALRSLTA